MLLKMETNSYNTDNILSDPFSSLAEDDINQKTSSSSLGFMEMLGFQDYYFDNTTTYQQQLPPLPPPPTSSLSMAVEVHASAAHQDNGDLGHDHMDNQDQFTTVDEESSVVLNGQPSSPNNSSSICTSPAHQRLHKPQCIKEKKAMSGDEIKAKKKKKEKAPRFAFMTRTDIDHLDDGYRWRKYGQKAVKNSRFPRSYYRCTSASCNVKKRVERCMTDPSYVITTYEGQHTHPVALNSTPLIPSYNNYITNAAFAATTAATPTPPAMLKLEQGGLLQDMLPCYH